MIIRRRTGAALISPLALVLIVCFAAPIILMLPTSFREYLPGMGITPGSWTIDNYAQIILDDYYREVVWRTFGLGLLVTAIALAIGYPLALMIVRGPERWRVPLILLVVFPMMLNLVVRSFGWIALLANRGLLNNLLIDLGLIDTPLKLMFNMTGVVIGLVHIYLPFMVLMLVAAIQAVPRDVEAAASTLGAGRIRTFFMVTLPLTASGILAGSILVFVLTISALVTPRMLGGATYRVLATVIYDEYMQLLNWPGGAALAFALTLAALVIVWASGRLAKRWGGMA